MSTFAFFSEEVVDLVGSALRSTDTLIDIIELSFRTFGAEVVDKEESWLANASADDPVLVL